MLYRVYSGGNAWNPINADGYMYIDCLWVAGSFKGNGYSTDLLNACIEDSKAKGKRESVSCQPLRKSLFWQIRSSSSIRDLQSAMKQIMVFSSGICLFLWMRLSLNLRSVRSIHILSRWDMCCTTRINVRLMQNMFRCFLKLPRKERFRFRQPGWKRKKKRRTFRHRLQPMHYFITENMSRMSR